MAKWAGRGGRKRRNTTGDLVIYPLKDLLWCDTHKRYLKPYGARSERLAKADNTELNGTGQRLRRFQDSSQEPLRAALAQIHSEQLDFLYLLHQSRFIDCLLYILSPLFLQQLCMDGGGAAERHGLPRPLPKF
jgi:hypothetical protein